MLPKEKLGAGVAAAAALLLLPAIPNGLLLPVDCPNTPPVLPVAFGLFRVEVAGVPNEKSGGLEAAGGVAVAVLLLLVLPRFPNEKVGGAAAGVEAVLPGLMGLTWINPGISRWSVTVLMHLNSPNEKAILFD